MCLCACMKEREGERDKESVQICLAAGGAMLHRAGGHLVGKHGNKVHSTRQTDKHTRTHTHSRHTDDTTHAVRTCGDVPDQQGRICGEGEAMSSAAVQDGVSGNLQRQLGLEVLIGQTVGAL